MYTLYLLASQYRFASLYCLNNHAVRHLAQRNSSLDQALRSTLN